MNKNMERADHVGVDMEQADRVGVIINGNAVASVQTTATWLPRSIIPHSRGFTLIEVLLAFAILAVVVTMIFTSFSTAGRGVEQADAVREETDLARALIARVMDDITNAYCGGGISSSGLVFYGKKAESETSEGKRRLDSIALTPLTNWRRPDSKESELWEVGYFFKEKPEGGGFVMHRREKRELTKESPPLEGGVEYELTDRVENFQLRYFNGSTWSDDWGSAATCSLPKAVEISLELDTGGRHTTQVETRNP